MPGLSRRTFLRTLALTPAVWRAWAADAPAKVRFGVISDVHQDVMHDAVDRLGAFVTAMNRGKPAFALQCGDFCQSVERNRPFLDVWQRLEAPRYGVLGNHDMDGRVTREQAAAFLGLPAPHYSFDAGPLRGLVLDGNEPGGRAKGYPRYIGPAQRDWLAAELARDPRPALIFVHQPLDDAEGVENAAEVRAVLDAAVAKSPGCVAAVFSGHLHRDYVRTLGGLPYVQVNSASYVWLAGKMARPTYPPEVHAAHPQLVNVAAYKEPLWAEVTLDRAARKLTIVGRTSDWVGPDPWTRGATEQQCARDTCRPAILDRAVALG